MRTALRQREGKAESEERVKREDTLDLEEERSLSDVSAIGEEKGCGCVYYEIHQHHQGEIRNLEARMRLLVRENQMLKDLLLKEGHPLGKHPDK